MAKQAVLWAVPVRWEPFGALPRGAWAARSVTGQTCGTSRLIWGEVAVLPLSLTLETVLTALLAGVAEIRPELCHECWA